MSSEGSKTVRAFPTRLLILSGCALILALATLGWTAYDGFQQSRATERLVNRAQALQLQMIGMQQSLSAMLIMASATGDIRWSLRYTNIINDLKTLSEDAEGVSGAFAEAADRMVSAGVGIAQVQAQVVELLRENRVRDARRAVLGPAFEAERDAFQAALEELGRQIDGLTRDAQENFERRFLWSALSAGLALGFAALAWGISGRRLREWRLALEAAMQARQRHEAELEARVSERTRASQEAEGRLRAAVENLSAGVVMVDRDLNLQLFNDRFVELYDLPGDLVQIGKPLGAIVRLRAERGEYGPGDPEQLATERLRGYREQPTAQLHDYIATADRTIELSRSGLEDGGVIAVFNDITERQRATALLEDAHAVMRDSIRYASRIQRSLLPSDTALDDMFAEHFCIWEPRDVVGGDMYWVREDRRGYFVALFDCTGHGVPGALMTTIAVSALNVAFAETGDPSRLIATVNRIVKQALAQKDEQGLSDDGLEMGICLVEPERMRVTYAGARFELLSAVGDKIELIKGDKSGLGYRHVPVNRRFTNHSLRLRAGQRLYMYSDGITDQVGGNKRRAFGRKRLMGLLGDVAHMPLPKQGASIAHALADYQGGEARRDDVSMIGFMPIR